jgi:hypothetical protein
VKNAAGTGSGVRWLDVPAARFPGWISSFAARHGEPGAPGITAPAITGITLGDGMATFTAPDGAAAECHPPFPESFAWPRRVAPGGEQSPAGAGTGGHDAGSSAWESAALIAAHAQVPRTVGVLLVRLGGYAAGVFAGYPPALADAKVGSRLVHGRSAAGGWSQQRFARRREKQASEALDAAAATAAAVFGRGPRLEAVVLGGDKRAVAELRDDPRLARYLALATERFLTVPDPKRAVLAATPRLFTAVRIRLTEPSG